MFLRLLLLMLVVRGLEPDVCGVVEADVRRIISLEELVLVVELWPRLVGA